MPNLRDGDVALIGAGDRVGRVYQFAGSHPAQWDTFRSFGPRPDMRFDHHPEQQEGVVPSASVYYGAVAGVGDPLATCLAEVYAGTSGHGTITVATRSPYFALWTPTRALRLLDLTDSGWVTRAGGNGALTSGRRDTARSWARAIHATYVDLDGLRYGSAVYPPGRSVLLFERAQSATPRSPDVNLPLSHPGLRAAVRSAAGQLGYFLSE